MNINVIIWTKGESHQRGGWNGWKDGLVAKSKRAGLASS